MRMRKRLFVVQWPSRVLNDCEDQRLALMVAVDIPANTFADIDRVVASAGVITTNVVAVEGSAAELACERAEGVWMVVVCGDNTWRVVQYY